jgi:hypothetical protein
MFIRRILCAAVVLPASLLIGCSSGNSSGGSSAAPAATQPAAVPIPPDSPFAKVKNGMSMEQVDATIGPPTTRREYQTGKGWIPYHFGGDNRRITGYYKGIGTITFSSDSQFSSGYSVMEVDYDPTEPGYPK